MHPSQPPQQDGSIALALLGIIIVGGLALALFALSVSAQRTVVNDREYNVAIFGADAGVQQALTFIAQETDESVTTISSASLGLSESQRTVGEVTYQWEAEKVDLETWEIRAVATSGDNSRTVEAVASRRSDHFLAAFADVGVAIRGDNGVSSYNRTTNEWNTGKGAVGSNGSITMIGNSYSDLIMLFGGNATCSGEGCETGDLTGYRDPINLDQLTEELDAEIEAACSSFAALTTSTTPLVGGNTYCVSDLHFDEDTTLVDATPENPVTIYVTGTVDTVNHTDVNCEGCKDNPSTAMPDSTLLRIRSTGSNVRLGNHTYLAAAVLAPQASCTGSPSNAQATVYGSMICNDLGNQGGWTFHWDEELLNLDVKHFDIVEWREEVGGSTSFGS